MKKQSTVPEVIPLMKNKLAQYSPTREKSATLGWTNCSVLSSNFNVVQTEDILF